MAAGERAAFIEGAVGSIYISIQQEGSSRALVETGTAIAFIMRSSGKLRVTLGEIFWIAGWGTA